MKTKIIALASFLALLMTACFNFGEENKATLTLHLSGSSNSRAALTNWPPKGIELDSLEYKINLSRSSSEEISFTASGSGPFTCSVSPGNYIIEIIAYSDNEECASGSKGITLTSGQNHAQVTMSRSGEYEAYINITPPYPFISKGGNLTFLVAPSRGLAIGDKFTDSYIWSVEGNTSSNTKINTTGTGSDTANLTIGLDETATTLTVKAVYAGDNSIFEIATVTITALPTYTVTFDLNGGSGAIPAQTISQGDLVTKPTDPTGGGFIPTTAGLYAGNPLNLNYTFVEWRKPDNTVWNFATDTINEDIILTAQWTAPTPTPTPIAVIINNVAAAITHVNANPEEYTLILDANDSIAGSLNLNTGNVKLTLIGLGAERKISLSSQGTLFTVGAGGQTGIELTLDSNITLVGLTLGQNGATSNNNAPVVIVQDGASFTMNAGSKVTGNHTASALGKPAVEINNASFTMNGGEITGNTQDQTGNIYPTGLKVSAASSQVTLAGGKISGNTGRADIVINTDVGYDAFVISGNMELGIITLLSNSGSLGSGSRINIGSDWTGSIASVNLHNGITGAGSIDVVKSTWVNQIVLQGAGSYTITAGDVGKVGLGEFRDHDSTSEPIAAPYYIDGGGVLRDI